MKHPRLPLVLILFALAGPPAHGHPVLDGSLWARAARIAGLAPHELYGIALQETGMRWRDGSFRPWPWTLYAPSGPERYASRADAEAALKRHLRRGVVDIDVGLMQVNLRYHGHRVANPADLLDPRLNLWVAAAILRETRGASTGKRQAIARYHSWRDERGDRYAGRVLRYAERMADASP